MKIKLSNQRSFESDLLRRDGIWSPFYYLEIRSITLRPIGIHVTEMCSLKKNSGKEAGASGELFPQQSCLT